MVNNDKNIGYWVKTEGMLAGIVGMRSSVNSLLNLLTDIIGVMWTEIQHETPHSLYIAGLDPFGKKEPRTWRGSFGP